MNQIKQQILDTHIFQLVTARLHQRKRHRELRWIFRDGIAQYRHCTVPVFADAPSNYIWLCWWQGWGQMSALVRECCERIIRFNPDKMVVLITGDNLTQYVDLPPYILEKFERGIITKTHMSDILRAELLARYGGVWMDATIYTFGPIPDRFYEKGLYTGRCRSNRADYNVSRNRWTSYFWVSPRHGHPLFCFLRDFWRTYWEKEEALLEYFLIDYVINLAYARVPVIRRELNSVKIDGCGRDFWDLLRHMRETYDPAVLDRIRSENWMQKLSYKGEEHHQCKAKEPERSFYKVLFLNHRGLEQ